MVSTAIFSIFDRQMPEPAPAAIDVVAVAPVRRSGSSIAAPEAARVEHPAAAHAAETELFWPHVPVRHDLLGLANPAVWTVLASYSPAPPIELSAARTGLYRPADFRPAPWSGFSYDVATDRQTGLLVGTKILTARGEVAVENLLPGDLVMALRGPALLPVLWIGRCVASEPPVVIELGALGQQRPSRALCVAADQSIFIDPLPVPAKRLVNGTTIRVSGIDAAELFHVDVGRAEVLFAANVALASAQQPAATFGR